MSISSTQQTSRNFQENISINAPIARKCDSILARLMEADESSSQETEISREGCRSPAPSLIEQLKAKRCKMRPPSEGESLIRYVLEKALIAKFSEASNIHDYHSRV